MNSLDLVHSDMPSPTNARNGGAPLAGETWRELIPFDERELPSFPMKVLPEALGQWVQAESHATQTPPDLAGLLALAICSYGISRRIQVEPRPGWREPTNLYTAILLEPGNRKSAVFADAFRPLREFEAEIIEAARPAVARAQSERKQAEARLHQLERRAAEKGDAEAAHQAGELAAELARQIEPHLPRLLVDDATAEKFGIMLAEQDGRIFSASPEGGVFDLMAGAYSKNGMPQFNVYLSGHSGDDLTTDRVGRPGFQVKRPAIACAYAIQPSVIRGLAKHEAFRGRGLLGRFIYGASQSWIGRRAIATTPVSDAVYGAYRRCVRTLLEDRTETVLRLTLDAEALLREWEAELEVELGEGGCLEVITDWGAKLAGETVRLAAVLHCVRHGPMRPIERQSIAAAIAIARFSIPHAEAVLNMMSASEGRTDDDAQYVLRWIDRHARREFTKSEAQHHGKRRFPKANDIDSGLAELVRRGYIRLRSAETSGPGRPPSPTFEVRPATLAGERPGKRSHNSHNLTIAPDCDHSGNNGNTLERAETTDRVQVTI